MRCRAFLLWHPAGSSPAVSRRGWRRRCAFRCAAASAASRSQSQNAVIMMPWRTVFFAVNFGATVLFVIACVVSIGESLVGGGSPGAFLGGFFFVWPAIAFGVAEWCLYVRKTRSLEQPLGVACGLVGGFAVFAFVSSAANAAPKGASPGSPDGPGGLFWMVFGSVCFVVAIHGLWCCWLRVRRRTFPEQRGFPVGSPTAPSPPAAVDRGRE